MPFQPCGYVVDWARRPFSARCRFTTDPHTPAGKIVFYGSKGPPLPFPTLFNNRWWMTEVIQALPLGGQVPRPRGYNGRWNVPGIVFGHYCGTPEMFVAGYNPATNPPTSPGPNPLIPPCCPAALGGLVSSAIWPTATVVPWRGPNYPPTGGTRAGGLVQSVVGPLRSSPGGSRAGGLVQHVVGPVEGTPGGSRAGGLVQYVVGPIQNTRPSGGYAIGGTVTVRRGPIARPTGGYAIGGAIGRAIGPIARPSGGYAIGGTLTPGVGPMIPVGGFLGWFLSAIPSGFLLCNGQTYSSSTYPALFAVLGTTTLPDFRGRMPIGAGTGSGLTNRVLLTDYGAETHTLTIAEMPSHYHDTTIDFGGGSPGYGIDYQNTGNVNTASSQGVQGLYPNGGGGAHAILNPCLAINWIIRAQ